jgi:hypothetical protein
MDASVPKDIQDLIVKCWDQDKDKRPDFDIILIMLLFHLLLFCYVSSKNSFIFISDCERTSPIDFRK